LCFSSSGYSIMTGSDDNHVRLFDLATAATLMKLKAHKVKL
jgi:WD40 repeat protein